MLFEFAANELAQGAKSIPALVQELCIGGSDYAGPERRRADRHHVVISIALVPVDHELNPMDVGFRGITRDMSASGVSFLHIRHVPTTHLIAQFIASNVGVVKVQLEVVRTDFLDPLYITAAHFVTPSARKPRKSPARQA
jgi:hypothetical protein